jgi:hypothetical protein
MAGGATAAAASRGDIVKLHARSCSTSRRSCHVSDKHADQPSNKTAPAASSPASCQENGSEQDQSKNCQRKPTIVDKHGSRVGHFSNKHLHVTLSGELKFHSNDGRMPIDLRSCSFFGVTVIAIILARI